MSEDKYTPEVPLKRCSKCGEEKPATLEFFYKSGKSLYSWCKRCHSVSQGHRPKDKRSIPAGMKHCNKCNRDLPATPEFFYVKRRNKDGLESQCKDCIRQWQRTYFRQYLQNPEAHRKHIERTRRYREKPGVREQREEYRREYQQKTEVREHRKELAQRHRQNPEVRAHNQEYQRKRMQNPEYRERRREYERQWRQDPEVRAHRLELARQYRHDNPEQSKIRVHIRLARKRELPDTLTLEDWQRALDYFGGCCAVCGKQADFWTVISLDHWIALSNPNCPGTVATNIIPLCCARKGVPAGELSCNSSKSNKDAETWLIERFGKRRAKEVLTRVHTYFEWLKTHQL